MLTPCRCSTIPSYAIRQTYMVTNFQSFPAGHSAMCTCHPWRCLSGHFKAGQVATKIYQDGHTANTKQSATKFNCKCQRVQQIRRRAVLSTRRVVASAVARTIVSPSHVLPRCKAGSSKHLHYFATDSHISKRGVSPVWHVDIRFVHGGPQS